jgi:serine phosphatase RsbU (regulator of sigma subunit)/Tfp pilus assembly protein PilF
MKFCVLYIVFFIFCLGTTVSFSQTYEEDSLTAAIFSTSEIHEKIMLMSELSQSYRTSDPQKYLELAYQSKELAKSPGDITFTHNFIGNGYLLLEMFDSALLYFQSTYTLAIENKDSVNVSKAANNMGIVYFNVGDIERGLASMIESAQIDMAIEDYDGAMISFSNVGAIYLQLKRHEESLQYLLKALKLSRKTGDKDMESTVLTNIGGLQIGLGNDEEGKKRYFEAIEIQKNMNDLYGIQLVYNNLGVAFIMSGKPKIAEIYYLKSLEYADTLKSATAFRAVYKGLAKSNENMGKNGRALDYYKLYMAWHDSVREQSKSDAIIEMQEKFSTKQTEKENELLHKENQIRNLESKESKAKLNQSRLIVGAAVFGLILLIGLAFVLFNRNRIKQRANIELQIANDIIQEKNDDITSSIEYASKIQEALLPTREDTNLFKDSFFILRPKDIVSGDFLWYSEIDRKIVFAAADCTGHGVPGAFMSMIGNTYLHQIVNEKKILQPSIILDELRKNVIKALSQKGEEDARKDGMDISICILDKESNFVEFAGANNPVYFVKNGEIKEIKGDKQPVGYMPERTGNFTNHKFRLEEGDALYIFSDGFADQFGGPKGKKFKYKQMRELLLANYKETMASQKNVLLEAFENWKGDLEQIDDVCMIGVRV